MTIEEIRNNLKTNFEVIRRTSLVCQLDILSGSGKDTDRHNCPLTAEPSDFEKHLAEAQRALNRQKKLLSLLRKSINR